MIKTDYITRAIKFYNTIARDIQNFEKPEEYKEYFAYYNMHHYRNVKIANGCARVAIITSDYVIKLDCGDPDYYGGCAEEVRAYKRACIRGVQGAFAPITEIAPGVYVMPKCKCNYCNGWDDEPYTVEQFYRGLSRDEKKFVSGFIYDIHEGNIGKLHKKIVLVDYAANRCSQSSSSLLDV